MWNKAKAVLRGKLIALNAYIRKEKKSQINNLSSYFKNLEKKEKNTPKASKWKEIINVKVEVYEIEKQLGEKQ